MVNTSLLPLIESTTTPEVFPTTSAEVASPSTTTESTTLALLRSTLGSVAPGDEDKEASFLGIGVDTWIIGVGIIAGVIALILICALICCFCSTAIQEDEEKKKKTKQRKQVIAAVAPPPGSTNGGAAAPVKTETVIKKEIEHLPDGRDLTTISASQTSTRSNGIKDRKFSWAKVISKKPRGRHHAQQQQPQLTSIRPLSSQYDQQQPQPMQPQQHQRVQTPRNDSTMVEMEPVLPQAPTYPQNSSSAIEQPPSRRSPFSASHQAPPVASAERPSSRRSPFSAPRVVTNYNVEPQPHHYPY